MNRALIVPLAALIAQVVKQVLGVDIAPEAIEVTINTIAAIVLAVVMALNRRKQKEAE